jgi:hypothetical protein
MYLLEFDILFGIMIHTLIVVIASRRVNEYIVADHVSAMMLIIMLGINDPTLYVRNSGRPDLSQVLDEV